MLVPCMTSVIIVYFDSEISSIDYMLCRISTLVSDGDLKGLIEKLGERNEDAEIWENVIQKSNPHVSYTAKCCKPKVIASFILLFHFSESV